jgi:hypothetical protein
MDDGGTLSQQFTLAERNVMEGNETKPSMSKQKATVNLGKIPNNRRITMGNTIE